MKSLLILGIVGVLIALMVQFPHTMLSPGELVTGHQKLNNDCFSCHEPFGGVTNEKCIACHKLSEIGATSKDPAINLKEKVLFHQKLQTQDCKSCHTDHQGMTPASSISTFKHEMLESKVMDNCVSCHLNPADNLHKQVTNACKNCHNTEGWKNAVSFNHDMIQGADKNNCASCHQGPKDTFHQSFKDNCNQCHSTNKWKPASFDHDAYFVLDKDHNAACTTCHTNNNFAAYTCYGCHEHTVQNIKAEHDEERIFNIRNCVSCHKSADEREGEGSEGGGDDDDD